LRIQKNVLVFKALMFLTLISTLFLTIAISVNASSTEIRVINPKTGTSLFKFNTTSTSKWDRFNTTIFLYEVVDLYAFQVRLYVNDTLLNITRAWLPTWDPNYVFAGQTTIQPEPTYYDEDGDGVTESVLVGDSILTGTAVTGDGLLAIIELEIIYAPPSGTVTCILDIDNVDTFLLDDGLSWIYPTRTGGYYEYTYVERLLPYLQIKPKRYMTNKLETFNITVYLNNTIASNKLVYIKFNFLYNTKVLNVTKVFEGPFLGTFGDTTFNFMFGTGGVTIENSLEPPYADFPEGNGIIAIITLQGIYQGPEEVRCDLEISDITLLNDQGELIEYDPPINGAYTISSVSYQITIDLHSDYWVKVGEKYKLPLGYSVTISGHIMPNPGPGMDVTIRVIKSGTPINLETVKTDDDGYYSYVWTPDRGYVGSPLGGEVTLKFQAFWYKGDKEIESNIWGVLVVATKESSTITVNVDPETVLLGKNVTISGEIQPKRIDVNVTVYYKASGETTWTLLKRVKTKNESRFNCTWSFEQLGTYEIKANWTGDLFTEGAESRVKIVRVVEKIEESFLETVMRHLPYILAGIAAIVAIVVIYFVKIRKS